MNEILKELNEKVIQDIIAAEDKKILNYMKQFRKYRCIDDDEWEPSKDECGVVSVGRNTRL